MEVFKICVEGIERKSQKFFRISHSLNKNHNYWNLNERYTLLRWRIVLQSNLATNFYSRFFFFKIHTLVHSLLHINFLPKLLLLCKLYVDCFPRKGRLIKSRQEKKARMSCPGFFFPLFFLFYTHSIAVNRSNAGHVACI